MKKVLFLSYLLMLVTLASCQSCSEQKKTNNIDIEKFDSMVPLADPFIMLYNGIYYAYGTHASNGIEVYTSQDLLTWEYAGLALNKKESWGERWFWAPEVYFVAGKFYMYYSADEHICVAIANTPVGPFVQDEKKPMIADEKCIDSSLFIDDDGTAYLSFVRFNDGNNIWIAELEKDFITIKRETLRPCIHMSQKWEEVWPRVNEGSFIFKHKGIYYMSYSGNSYESPFYGVGCATTTDLMGKWTKYDENPLLQKPGKLVGVGHSSIFTDKAGNLRIVYHAHKDKKNIHPRAMYVGDVYFENINGVDRMRISKEYIIPKLVKRKCSMEVPS